jgi:hypothetical protein
MAEHVDVDRDAIAELFDRIAPQGLRVPERASQLREVPAKRGHRVVGFTEQQTSDTLARGWSFRQREVSQQRPRFAPSRRQDAFTAARDARLPEQGHLHVHPPASRPIMPDLVATGAGNGCTTPASKAPGGRCPQVVDSVPGQRLEQHP